MTRLTMLPLLLLLAAGCYKIDYVQGPSDPFPSETEWHHIGIFGLVEFTNPVRLDQICPQGWARVHNERSFLNGLVTRVLSLWGAGWVYQPHTVKVYCSSGQTLQVELNDQGLATSAQPAD